MKKINVISIEETDSTNRYLHDYRGEEGELMTAVVADFQTAGKGQGTNSWESERGKNLTVSIKLRPFRLQVVNQYVLHEIMALSVCDTLSEYVSDVTIKWPNDIYVGNRKICGTISECSFSSKYIDECILGSGVNINQTLFRSDAPNPVSLKQITGETYSIDEILSKILHRLEHYLIIINKGFYDVVHSLYLSRLYRRSGFHLYSDGNGDFLARIVEVEPNGMLVLERENGSRSSYAFKEVSCVFETNEM